MLKLEIQDYGHPTTHPAEMITQNPTHRMVTDQQIFDWESMTAPRVYFELAINEPPHTAGDFWLRLDDNATLISNGSIWMGVEAGQGMIKGICFLRQDTDPGIPVGGSFTDPTADGWSDGVPAGTKPLWMTTRLFTTNGSYPQQASWTAPVITSALGQGMRAMFSINGEDDPAGDWHEFGTINDWFMRIDVSTDGGVTWTLGGVSKVKGEQGEIGVGQFKSTIFIRSVADPGVPTGGDFTNPVADGGWSDGIPVGALPLWMSTRIFTGDAQPPQQAAWTIPNKVSALGEGVQAEFSVDGLPPWSTTAKPADKYMRINTSDDGGLTWSYGVAVKIKGETGNSGGTGAAGQSVLKSTCFIRTNLTPDAPVGGSYADPIADPDPTYGAWSDGTPAGVELLWMTTRIFSSDALSPQQPSWTEPQPMGQIGDHANGANVRYIFSSAATAPALPPANSTAGWDTAASIDTVWVSLQHNTTDASGTILGYGAWEVASKIKGEAGDGMQVEYSIDGSTNWHEVADPADVYMRINTSADGGITWDPGAATKIKGEPALGYIPQSFTPGLIGGSSDIVFTLNALTSGPNPGEIRIQGSKFDHPDGTARVVQADSDVHTPYGEGEAGRFYLMWTDTVRTTRFPTGVWGGSTNIIPIRIVGGVWKAFDNGGTDYALTIVATDVIIAAVEGITTTSGLTAIQSFLGGAAQSAVVGIAFTRSNSQPATPPNTQGNYSAPTPSAPWEDGIPTGTLPIWSTTRLFTSDGLSPQSANWTVPQKVGELGESVRALFSLTENGSYHTPGVAADEWMRVDETTNGGASWVTGTPTKIKGESSAANLVINGNFNRSVDDEANPVGWAAAVSGTVAHHYCQYDSGNGLPQDPRALFFYTNIANTTAYHVLHGTELMAVDRTRNYCQSVWIREYSGVSKAYLGLYFYDKDLALISEAYLTMSNYRAATTWEQKTYVIGPGGTTAFPANTCYVKTKCVTQYQSVGATLMTRFQFAEGTSPPVWSNTQEGAATHPFVNLAPGHSTFPSGLSSNGWVEGSVGWAIGKGGNAEFFNIKIRGGADIYGNLSVLTAHINALAVTNAKIASLAVTEAKIGNLAVTTAKIALLAVKSAQIDALAVTAAKIGTLAVTTAKIDDLAVTNIKIDDLAVSTLKIADQAITFAVDAYTTGFIGDNGTNWVIGQQLTITATGAPHTISWSFKADHYADATNDNEMEMRIRCSDGTYPYGSVNGITCITSEADRSTQGALIAGSARHTPAAGSKTYYLEFNNVRGSGGSSQMSYRFLLASESKK